MRNPLTHARRVLLKISGEFLMGKQGGGISEEALSLLTRQLQALLKNGYKLSLALGGGNFFRGITAPASLSRVKADQMGMLATLLNGLAVEDHLNQQKISSSVYSAIEVPGFCEKFSVDKALKNMEEETIPIFVGGLGAPFFSTDTGAIIRALEMKCDVVIKGTQVDGVYTDDPRKNPQATRLSTISYNDIIQQQLQVMDLTAVSLAKAHQLPVVVCSIHEENSFRDVFQEKIPFTLIH